MGQIPLVCFFSDADYLFMPMIINLQCYTSEQLRYINRSRLYLHVVTLADVYTGEGIYVCSTMTSNAPQLIHSTYQWPAVVPTPGDFVLWRPALSQLSGCRSLGD